VTDALIRLGLPLRWLRRRLKGPSIPLIPLGLDERLDSAVLITVGVSHIGGVARGFCIFEDLFFPVLSLLRLLVLPSSFKLRI
jgi:hypothetical protein